MIDIQITDKELFEIIGRSQVEIFSKDKELTAYQQQFEKVKSILAEAEPLRAAKAALEISNKQLSEKNVQLDQALTEARKEREALRVQVANGEQLHTEALHIIDAKVAEINELRARFDKLQTGVPPKKSRR